MLDLIKLIQITLNYMREHNMNDLLESKLPSSNPKSCWGWLTIQLYDNFNAIKSLNIYNMWVRDTKKFKSKVKAALNETEPIQENESNGKI